jgi:hypothetical protein
MNRNILILSLTIILAGACAQQAEKAGSTPDVLSNLEEKSVTDATATPQTDLYSDGKTKLIKNANYRFEVENVKKSTEAIVQAIRKFPAYVSSSSMHLENPILENKITIRVQNEYFQELLQEIDRQALFVNRREVTTNDVSKEFVDLESRLKTKREVEARYVAILRTKAGTIEELLDAERQIGALHEEIEATISRINHLRDQVSYSTINLEIYQTVTQQLQASDEPTVKHRFTEGLAAGWQGVVAIGIALSYIWPLILIGVGVLTFVKLRRKLHPSAFVPISRDSVGKRSSPEAGE